MSALPDAGGPPQPLLRPPTPAPHGSSSGATCVHWLPSPDELIAPVQLHFDRTADPQSAHRGPDAPLTVQNPVVQALLCGRLEQLQKVAGGQVRDEGQAGTGDGLVDEEAPDRGREHAERVQLAEPVVHFERREAEQRHHDATSSRLPGVVRMLAVIPQEGRDVGSGLADDEVVDVEEFGDAGEGGVALVGGVGGGFPAAECYHLRGDEPGHYGARFVLAEEAVRVVEAGAGGVGSKRGGPDEHVGRCDVVQEVGDAATARGGDGDVEHSFRTGVGFFKGEIADVGSDALFEDVDVQEVTFSDKSRQSAETGLYPACLMGGNESLLLLRGRAVAVTSGESRQIDAVAVEEIQ